MPALAGKAVQITHGRWLCNGHPNATFHSPSGPSVAERNGQDGGLASINTNKAALQALQALNANSASAAEGRQRLSTGKNIASAKDNGATFAIAQTMRGEVGGWRTAAQTLDRGRSIVEVAAEGAQLINDLLLEVQAAWTAYADPSIDGKSREALRNDIEALVRRIDQTAKGAAFGGRNLLADNLVTSIVTNTVSTYALPGSGLTPPSFSNALQTLSGGGSQTLVLDGGPAAGRVDMVLEAYSAPDALEVWQSGTRIAATGQAYPGGGGGVAVGPASQVSGQNLISFDYNPALGQNLEIRFNENFSATGSVWNLNGLVLATGGSPLPAPTPVSTSTQTSISTPVTYKFIASADGDTVDVSARPLTASFLGLEPVDFEDPNLGATIKAAIAAAIDAGTYFGSASRTMESASLLTSRMDDVLTGGIGNLVDADMAKEAARLEADQARQQLAAQALAIANAAPAMLLALFRT